MHVTELAQRAGVEAHVVRFYTQSGLLHPRRDPKNRYREYAQPDVRRVRFIRRARCLSFTLKDIEAILSDADAGVAPSAKVREIVETVCRANRKHLRDLEQLQDRIERAVAQWQCMPGRQPDHASLRHFVDAVADDDGGLI